MKTSRIGLLCTILLFAPGCYHAKVMTGESPGNAVIDIPFASSWIYGLVPPKTVEAAAECPGGVAIVETQQSFVNGLVGILTFGIYTPMRITVTCAASSSASAFIPRLEISMPKASSTADW